MKIVKHFFQTILMVASLGIVAMLPRDSMAQYVHPILGIAIAGVLIFAAVYLYRGRKKGIFCFIAIFLSFLISGLVYAQSNDDASDYYRGQLNEYCKDFCSEVNKFDPEKAVKNDDEPDEEMIDQATKFSDMVDRAIAVGYAERNFWTQLWNGKVTGKASWWTDNFSKQYECAVEFLEEVAEYKILKKESSMKNVYNLLKADNKTCWPCGIINLVIESVEKITLSMESSLKQAALSLLGIMTLFWILVKVLMLIGQFGTANNAEFFTELLVRLFLVVIAAAILQAPLGQFYRMTFSPFISATAKLTQQFTNYGDEAQGMGTSLAGTANLKCACCEEGSESDCNGGKLIEYGVRYNNGQFAGMVDMKKSGGGDVYEGLLDLDAKRDLMCMTCSVYKQTAPMVAAGRVMTYFSIHTGPEKLSWWKRAINGIIEFATGLVFPYPMGMWFVGMILIVVFTWLAFCIAFKTIDIFLRFGFVVLLTPFLITAYVFPISRKYTQRGWEFLVHSMISILALGIGISFVMSLFMAAMPTEFASTTKEIMARTNANMGNSYASDLWHAFINTSQDTKWDSGSGGSFFPLLWMIVICFMGTKILSATSVIVEGLSGISMGIPSISGAAVMGAIRAAYSPFKMAKSVAQDRLGKITGSNNEKSDQSSVLTKLGKWGLKAADTVEKVGKNAGKGVQASGKAMQMSGDAMEKTGAAAGESMKMGGKGMALSGKAMMGSGFLPLMIVGAAVAATGYAAQATGTATKYASKIAGKTVKAAGKVTEKAGKVVNVVAKPVSKITAKGLRFGSRVAGKVGKKVDNFKKKVRAIKNRVKKMIPPRIRKHLHRGKTGRRKRAASKYGQRVSDLLDSVDNGVENVLSAGDSSFGQNRT